jgi:signal peptidase I
MTEPTRKRRRFGAVRLAISALILLIVGGIWGLFLFGELRVERVGSGSMEPNFLENDILLVRAYHGGELQRGDVIVLNSPDDDYAPLLKRIVAVPGDRVDTLMGVLLINGEASPPPGVPYWWTGWSGKITDLELGPHEFYVLGDNREQSHDSRDFGPVPRSLIIGKPIWRTGPAGRRGRI